MAAAASGVLFAAGFPPFSMGPAAWVAFVPLFLVWEGCDSGRSIFTDAYAAFLIAFALVFQWPLFHTFGTTALLSLPGLLVIPMWMAVPFGISNVLRRRLGLGAGLAAFGAFYLLMELALRRGPLAFPWSLLGHTQAGLPPINGLAALGGVPLLSGFALGANVLFFVLWRAVRTGGYLPKLATAGLPLSLAAATLLLPQSDRGTSDSGSSVAVGIVQPALPAERWADVADTARVHELLGLSRSLDHRELDLIVWPETALPPDAGSGAAARRAVSSWVDSTGIPLLTGAIDSSEHEGLYYNAALLFRPHAAPSRYRKRRLVPFAERVPFQEKWPALRRLAIPSGGVSGYLQGSDDGVLEIPGARFGVHICFETLFDDATRTYARQGADFILAITQDGWWGDSFGLRQHLAFNRLRALETGLPLVQVSVSGLSGVIPPDGTFRKVAGWMERRAYIARIDIGDASTMYVRFGDLLTPVTAVVAALLILLSAARRPE